MMETSGERLWRKFLAYLSTISSIIITGSAVLIYFFFPAWVEELRKFLLFSGPAIILSLSLLLVMTRNKFQTSKDANEGIYEYRIVIKKVHIYLIDLIIYAGTFFILFAPGLLEGWEKMQFSDLIQAIIFFWLASQIKKIFYRRIERE